MICEIYLHMALGIVQVVVKVHERQQNAPQWQSTPQCRETSVVYEDIQINTVLIRCYAVVGEDKKRPVSYKSVLISKL